MLSNKRGIVFIALIIWILIIGAIIFYVPRLYDWYIERTMIRIIKSNVESVEKEIKSLLMDKHSVSIWHDTDNIIKSLKIQNPVTKEPQIRNGWSSPGDIVVYFDARDTFTLDGIGPDGAMLHLNIVIKK